MESFTGTNRLVLSSIPTPSDSRVYGVRVSCSSSSSNPNPNPIAVRIKTAATAGLILSAASAALFTGNIFPPPARADPVKETQTADPEPETKPDPIELSSETVDSLRSLLYKKLEDGEDAEALTLLNRLILSQPSEKEWKFLAARLYNEMGETLEARRIYEEILAVDPLSFEALFENAVLMDRCGEGEAVIGRLESALEVARSEKNDKSVRDVKLIMGQIRFLQRSVDEALGIYEELAREDPKDYRPWFCQGVIYSLMERNKEAREKFARYKELAPKKFDVDAYLQTPLSRVKMMGTEDS